MTAQCSTGCSTNAQTSTVRTTDGSTAASISPLARRTIPCICLTTQQQAATSKCSITSSAEEPTPHSAQLYTLRHDVQTAKRYLVGPMMQILGLAALRAQAFEIRSRDSSDAADSALSMRGLVVQAVVFLLVGISFMWRIRVPSEELDEHFVVNLQMWYWTVGWATINNVIFAVAQGVLAWIAWCHEAVGGNLSERSALLE